MARRALPRAGATVLPFDLHGRYVNVNSCDDLNLANALARDATFATRTASLVYVVGDLDRVEPAAILEFAAHARSTRCWWSRARPGGLEAVAGHPTSAW